VLVEGEHRLHKFVTCERKAWVGEDFFRGISGMDGSFESREVQDALPSGTLPEDELRL
jgi:hypothetical protein